MNRREQTSEDQSVADRGRKSGVHVFVVDKDGKPVTGQDVSAHFSYARRQDTVRHQYTDVEGHAEFSREHPDEPMQVEIFARGESFGRYTVENGSDYTVELHAIEGRHQ